MSFLGGLSQTATRILDVAGFRVKQEERRQEYSDSLYPMWFGGNDVHNLDQEKTETEAYRGFAEKYARDPLDYMAATRVIEAVGMAGMNNLRVFQMGDEIEGRDPINDHVLFDLLKSPNPNLTRFEFFEAVAGWLAVAGNTYIYIHPDNAGLPASLWILPAFKVKPVITKKRGLESYAYTVNNKTFTLDALDVMHVRRWNPLSQYYGLSPSEAIVASVANDLSMIRYNLQYFISGGRPSVVIESDREQVDRKQLQLMQREFEEKHTGGPEEMHKPITLWDGFKLKPFSSSPKDADFVEGRKANQTDIWGVRGVHPGVLTSESVNRANAETGEYVMAKYTILPVCVRIEGQFNKDLMPRYLDDSVVKFVDVVPQNKVEDADVNDKEAAAIQKLMSALGPVIGFREAKRRGLIGEEIDEQEMIALMESVSSMREQMQNRGDGESLDIEEMKAQFAAAQKQLAGLDTGE